MEEARRILSLQNAFVGADSGKHFVAGRANC
jgi:hypothetical protein